MQICVFNFGYLQRKKILAAALYKKTRPEFLSAALVSVVRIWYVNKLLGEIATSIFRGVQKD
jgi:hypothetical protein